VRPRLQSGASARPLNFTVMRHESNVSAGVIGAVALAVIGLVAYFAFDRPRPSESVANATGNTQAVWLALLKGFTGDVVYVGSDDAQAYFRIGSAYYKVPTCAVRLPESFPLGRSAPYAVKLHVEHGEIRIVNECAKKDGYALGQVDRK
jgi:hypothetical protein